jgi:glycosyltransferase involved in cell wall biosynthesis
MIGAEILRALWGTDYVVTVVSWQVCPPRGEKAARTQPIKWLMPPAEKTFPELGSARFVQRAADWLWHSALDVCRARGLRWNSASVAIVNGFDNVHLLRYSEAAPGVYNVLVVHDSPSKCRLPGQPTLGSCLKQMGRFSHFVFPSENVRAEWAALESVSGRPSIVIPNCCREDRVAEVRAESRAALRSRFGWRPEDIVILCLGSLQFLKGQDILVEAFPRIVEEFPNALLSFVGAPKAAHGRSFIRTLEQRIAGLGMNRHVRFLGPREDGLECIRAADILAVPSRCEVMPVTILEAMALETPVVASAVGGIPELVEDGQTGCLFPAEGHKELAAALLGLVRGPHARRSLAAAGRERYWSRFSRELFRARYVAALEALLRGEKWA